MQPIKAHGLRQRAAQIPPPTDVTDDEVAAAMDPPSRRVLLDFIEHTGYDQVPLYAIGSVGGRDFRIGLKGNDLQSFAKFQAKLAERTGLWCEHPAETDARLAGLWRREVADAFERGRRTT